ncbi:MAG: hypothetical protein LC723_06160 [Actinobacteria bacterium]|nr:hypothetical protein [Actinomycetota bacterium]
MTDAVIVALIASGPPTAAAVLAYLSSRSVRRSVGRPEGVPLSTVVGLLVKKVDRVVEGQADIRERIARLEGDQNQGIWTVRR